MQDRLGECIARSRRLWLLSFFASGFLLLAPAQSFCWSGGIIMSSTRATRSAAVASSSVVSRAMSASSKRSSSSKTKKSSETQSKKKQKIDDSNLPWYTFFTNSDPAYNEYMSSEWGVEKRDDRSLFEKLSLEGAQAGLSWRTILTKREAYRKTFHNFDVNKVAKMKESDITKILAAEGSGSDIVVRHRGKIESVINNAKCIQEMRKSELKESGQTFGEWLWGFVDDKPILNSWKAVSEMPSKTDESEAMSKALRKRGFRFVGPTTCYSLMQACGFVIDHPVDSEEWIAAKAVLDKRPSGYQRP